MLAWFDEPEELLHQCVSGAAVIVDRIVAADGAYEHVADRRPSSPESQRDAIRRAGEASDLRVDFLPARIWDGQVQKRNALVRGATEEPVDFVLPLDADWVLHGDRHEIRETLARARADQFYVRFWQPENPGAKFPHDWHADYAGARRLEPMVMRALEDLRCERLHYAYSGVRDGRRLGLKGGAQFYPEADSDFLPLTIEHRCMFRDEKTLERNRLFCEARDAERATTGVER